MTITRIFGFILLSIVLFSCSQSEKTEKAETINKADPLPSWNEGITKSNIINYIKEVTEIGNSNFIEIKDRIATFDNDGNLWSEQPAYFQLFFAIDRIKALAPEHPEWKNEQPYKAVLENNMHDLLAGGTQALVDLVMTSHSGNTASEFNEIVLNWLKTAKHPTKNRPYTDLVYQPMLELIKYLQKNDFKVFIVSGGGIDFMRPWVEGVYGIPKDQVVGSMIKTEFDYNDGNPVIRRLPELIFNDDKSGKPIGIHNFIGRKPVFSSGNSDGDLQMMQYTASNSLKSFMLYVHHTDSVREWAYDRDSHIGRLDKGLDEAIKNAWTVIDMAKDWKVIYPFELEK